MTKRLLAICLLTAGCGLGGFGASTPTEENRGESGAVNPVRGTTIYNSCEVKKGNGDVSVVINNTNNCNKDNPVTNEGGV